MDFFREVSKRITPFMKEKGFVLSRRNYYYIANSIAFCIAFDIPSGQMYVTAYVMPLYIPCDCTYYTYGNRLNAIHDVNLPTLSRESSETTIDEWCKLLCYGIDRYIVPFFTKVESANKLLEFVDKFIYYPNSYIACHELYIWRLKMFTLLHAHDFINIKHAITRYREELNSISFLSNKVLQKYKEEIDKVESLIQTKELVKEFCASVEIDTRKILQ